MVRRLWIGFVCLVCLSAAPARTDLACTLVPDDDEPELFSCTVDMPLPDNVAHIVMLQHPANYKAFLEFFVRAGSLHGDGVSGPKWGTQIYITPTTKTELTVKVRAGSLPKSSSDVTVLIYRLR